MSLCCQINPYVVCYGCLVHMCMDCHQKYSRDNQGGRPYHPLYNISRYGAAIYKEKKGMKFTYGIKDGCIE